MLCVHGTSRLAACYIQELQRFDARHQLVAQASGDFGALLNRLPLPADNAGDAGLAQPRRPIPLVGLNLRRASRSSAATDIAGGEPPYRPDPAACGSARSAARSGNLQPGGAADRADQASAPFAAQSSGAPASQSGTPGGEQGAGDAPGSAAAHAGPAAEAHGAGAAGWPLWAGAGRGVLEAAQEVAHRLRGFRAESDGSEGAPPGSGLGSGPAPRPADAGGIVTPYPLDAGAAEPDPDPRPNPAALDQLDLDRAFAELDAVLGESSRQLSEGAVCATSVPGLHRVSGAGEATAPLRSEAANSNAEAATPGGAALPAPGRAPGLGSGPQSPEQAGAASAERSQDKVDAVSGPGPSAGGKEAGLGPAAGRAPCGGQDSGSAAASEPAAPAPEAEEARQHEPAAQEPETDSGERAGALREPDLEPQEPEPAVQDPDLALQEPGFPASAASDGSFMSAASGSLASALSEGFAGGAASQNPGTGANPERPAAALLGAEASSGGGARGGEAQPTGSAASPAQPADGGAQARGDAGGVAGAVKPVSCAPANSAEPGAAAAAAAPTNGSAPQLAVAAQQRSVVHTLPACAGAQGEAPQAASDADAATGSWRRGLDSQEDCIAAAGAAYRQNGMARSAVDACREQGSASPFGRAGSKLHDGDRSSGPGPRLQLDPDPDPVLGSGSGELPVSHHAAAPALSLASVHDLPTHSGSEEARNGDTHAAAGESGGAAPARHGEALREGAAGAALPEPSGAAQHAGAPGGGAAGGARLPGGAREARPSGAGAGDDVAGAGAVPDLGFSGAAAGSAAGSAVGSTTASERADSEAQGMAPMPAASTAAAGGSSDAGDSFSMVAPSDVASMRADSDGARLLVAL